VQLRPPLQSTVNIIRQVTHKQVRHCLQNDSITATGRRPAKPSVFWAFRACSLAFAGLGRRRSPGTAGANHRAVRPRQVPPPAEHRQSHPSRSPASPSNVGSKPWPISRICNKWQGAESTATRGRAAGAPTTRPAPRLSRHLRHAYASLRVAATGPRDRRYPAATPASPPAGSGRSHSGASGKGCAQPRSSHGSCHRSPAAVKLPGEPSAVSVEKQRRESEAPIKAAQPCDSRTYATVTSPARSRRPATHARYAAATLLATSNSSSGMARGSRHVNETGRSPRCST
jgi:hypothetical protein